MAEQMFDLKLKDGQVVQWPGANGTDAALRYVAMHQGAVVVGWRYPQFEFKPGMIRIVEEAP